MPAPEKKPDYAAVVEMSKAHLKAKAKQEAFVSMRQLEGWCSQEKAAIMVDLVFETDAKTVVEIGVFGGKSLVPMAVAMKYKGSGVCFGVDPWSTAESLVGMDGVNAEWWGRLDHEVIYRGLTQKIEEFGLDDTIVLIRETSKNAPEIEEIDILHIDGNHSEETSMVDVTKWVPLVKPGGFIVFDDMTWHTQANAVAWLDAHCIKLAEYSGDNVWGIWVKP